MTIRKRLHRIIPTVIVPTVAALTAILVAAPARAQWIDHPNPGIPSNAAGKPDLTAATPKMANGKPDLSGVWNHLPGQNQPPRSAVGQPGTVFHFMPPGAEVSLLPSAEALYKQRAEALGAGRPSEHCLPHGIPDAMTYGGPLKIVQNPALMVILYEEFNHFRQIYTDGRGAPQTVLPAWFGYSNGKWDGETMAVDTIGFNNQSWLDDSGHPHTDALHTIERFHRRDFGHMDVQVTIDDPKAYTKPWSMNIAFNLLTNVDLLEYVCDNEKDSAHIRK